MKAGVVLVEAPKPEPFSVEHVSELEGAQSAQVVQRLVAGVTVVGGAPNTGKSAFMIDACLHVAAGLPFFGRKVVGGPVLYLAAEAPASVIARARAAIRHKFDGKRLPFYLVREVPRLGSETEAVPDLERLIASAEAVASLEGEAVAMSVWDTAAMLLQGADENGAGMVMLAAAARNFYERTGAAVALIHHPGKGDGNSLRGHSSLPAAADVVVVIEADALTKVRTVRVVKARDFEIGGEVRFELEVVEQELPDAFGDPASTIIVRSTEVVPASVVKATGRNQQRALDALRVWARTNPTAPAITSPELAQLLQACELGRQRRPEVMKFLTGTGYLVAAVGGYTINRELLK